MDTDIYSETLISFREAAKILPRGSRPSYSTWWRWWKKGVRGQKLQTVLVGGKRYTSPAAVRRFSDALSSSSQQAPTQSRLNRERQVRRAERTLEDSGVISKQKH